MSIAVLGNRFKAAEFVRNVWHVTPVAGDTPETLLDPKWWVHVQRQLKVGDKIEVLAETREWYAECLVLDTGIWGAKVSFTVQPVALVNEARVEAPEDYEVKWAGPHAKHRVIRKSDNVVLKDGCATKEEAASWIKSHRQAMAA